MKINTIELMELDKAPDLINDLKELLIAYGFYMYGQLGLVAGKESFFKELDHIPGYAYAPPNGTFIIAKYQNKVIGCVGIKKFKDESCEMKRMYIVPSFRGKGIGKYLCKYVIEWCRTSTYKKILLDTNKEMKEAVHLYHSCGFFNIPPYCINENEHPVFMQYDV